MPAIVLVFLIVTGFLVWILLTFNTFVSLRNQLREDWSEIEVQLAGRHALVPIILSRLKSSKSELSGRLLRFQTRSPESLATLSQADRVQVEQNLSKDLLEIFSVETISGGDDLLDRLSEIENQLQRARRNYNGTARELNVLTESFPSLLVAQAAGQKPVPYFETHSVTEQEKA